MVPFNPHGHERVGSHSHLERSHQLLGSYWGEPPSLSQLPLLCWNTRTETTSGKKHCFSSQLEAKVNWGGEVTAADSWGLSNQEGAVGTQLSFSNSVGFPCPGKVLPVIYIALSIPIKITKIILTGTFRKPIFQLIRVSVKQLKIPPSTQTVLSSPATRHVLKKPLEDSSPNDGVLLSWGLSYHTQNQDV